MKDSFQENSSPQHNDITKYSCKIGKIFKSINMLTSRNFYSEIVQKVKIKATYVMYFEKILAPQKEIDWEQVYMPPRKSTIESKMRSFQFKILHNVLFLNAKLFKMHIVDTPLCWFCKEGNETPTHLFSQCVVTTSYWEFLQEWLKPSLKLPNLTPESEQLCTLFYQRTPTFRELIHIARLIYNQF